MQNAKNNPLPEAKNPPSLDERAPPGQPPPDHILAAVLENTPMLAAYLDTRFNFTWVNFAYAKAGRQSPAYFVGRNHFDLYPSEENQAIFQNVVDTGVPFFAASKPFVYPDQPGRGTTWWDWSLVPVRDESGKTTGLVLTLEEVTDQVTTRHALRQSEANLAAMIEAGSQPAFLVDNRGAVIICNQAGAERVGRRREEILGQSIFSLVAPDIAVKRRVQLQKVVETGKPLNFEDSREGRRFSHHLRPILDDSDRVGRVAIFSHDITELKQAEARLRMMAAMVDDAPNSITVHDIEGRFRYANRKTFEIHGYRPEEFMALNLGDLDVSESGARIAKHMRQIEEKGQACFEVGHFRKDGSVIPLQVSAKKVVWDEKPAVLSIATDITERKLATQALMDSERKWRNILVNIPQVGVSLDPLGRIVFANAYFLKLTGWTEPEVLGQDWFDRFIPDSVRAQMRQVFSDILKNKDALGVMSYENEIVTRTGGLRNIAWSSVLTKDAHGEVIDVTCLGVDLTDRQRVDARNRQLLDIIEKSLNEIYIFAPETLRFRHVNQGALKNLQYSLEQIRAMTPVDLKPEFTEDTFRAKIQPLLNGEKESLTFETIHRRADGSQYPVEIHLQLMESGGKRYFLAIIFDITDRRQAEAEREKLQAQLLQAQKMESVGRLAGGVAHDFNNMLGAILGYSELALDQIEPGQPLFENLQGIRKAAQRSADLTRQLLAFARRQTAMPKVLDLNDTVEGMLGMLRRLIGEDIDLHWLPATKLWPVKIDPSQLDQILVNLCINARDAIDAVGRVEIRTGTIVFDAAQCAENPEFSPGQYTVLVVSDDGCGMNDQTREHLFEPFFTTKGLGQGTGLGLPTVYGIVKQNNGFIHVESQPGRGATFRIFLPRHQTEPVMPDSVQDKPGLAPGGRETILLVEDEPAILSLGRAMLEKLGYRVLTASMPEQALMAAKTHRGRIDLLITDVIMPSMNGRDLAEQLRVIFPDLKILFMSGYTADAIAHHGVLEEGVQFIQKPFSRKALALKVAEALA
jgi:PAS domain S-box-containing protein